MNFDQIVESLIKEAQARGEFDNLPGRGKPIDLTEYFSTPEDVRVAQTLLKNSGFVPIEIELLQDIAALKEKISVSISGPELQQLHKTMKEKQLELNILLERRNVPGRKK